MNALGVFGEVSEGPEQFCGNFGDFSAAFGECQFVIGIWDRLRGGGVLGTIG